MLKAPVAGSSANDSLASLKAKSSPDIATAAGLALGFGAMIASFLMEDGKLPALVNLSGAVIVFGGTLGAALLSSPLSLFLRLPILILRAFLPQQLDPIATINGLVSLADTARREGLLALESRSSAVGDKFLLRGIQVVVDGAEPETTREILELELEQMELRHEAGYGLLEAMGGFAPTMGIIGTVMGLVQALGATTDPTKLAGAIAVAFIATLYGVSSANLLWLPLGSKLKKQNEQEVQLRELMIQGLLAIQAGENPRVIREKLLGFVPPARRTQRQAEKAGKAGAAEEAA
jgi:chemotaxis protein MotA